MKIVAAKKILSANDFQAERIHQRLTDAGAYCVNILGSPGAGKTTLVEKLIPHLRDRVKLAVIEGDLATSRDAERIVSAGARAVQINTEGGCHLDANMVESALEQIDLTDTNMLLVENVGNLVCTAGFKLGEHLRAVVLSVTEGDDKVVKYPPMFQKTNAVILNKIDLLPYIDFDVERLTDDLRRLNEASPVFQVSARTGEGVEALAGWLVEQSGLKQ